MKSLFKVCFVASVFGMAQPAMAAIDSVFNGNGSLVLTLLDRTANVSATFDLGRNYSDFNVFGASHPNSGIANRGVNISWNLSSNTSYAPAWSQYLASASLANTQYAITAGDGWVGTAGVGMAGFITTYKLAGSVLATSGLLAAIGDFQDFYINSNISNDFVVFQNHTTNANGSSVAIEGDAYAGSYFSETGRANGTGPVVMGNIGESLSVAQVLTGSSNFAASNVNVYGNGAKFLLGANGVLTYGTDAIIIGDVPEPESWAMMLLGLGALGFVVRKRTNKKLEQ
jgi:PEP-CTERM motif